jgi:hypothetical protein
MGFTGDKKGISITICQIPNTNKIITRYNYVEKGEKKLLVKKFFGVSYTSYHSEIRVLQTIINNPFYLENVKKAKYLRLTNLRYNRNGNMSYSSKPCQKCVKVLKLFKEKYGLKKINVEYIENGQVKLLTI